VFGKVLPWLGDKRQPKLRGSVKLSCEQVGAAAISKAGYLQSSAAF